jgi:hypothetical protein
MPSLASLAARPPAAIAAEEGVVHFRSDGVTLSPTE